MQILDVFLIGKYCYKMLCDVVSIKTSHLLLRRPSTFTFLLKIHLWPDGLLPEERFTCSHL
jgi:hypothetical protein